MAAGRAAGRGSAALMRLLPRASLNLVDQLLSALTNVALSVIVARAVDAAGFGAFAIAFLVFGVLIGVGRSLVGTPLNIRFSGAEGPQRREVLGAATGTVLALGLGAAVPMALVGILLRGTLGWTLLVLAVSLPGLLIQDTCRLAFFAQGHPHLAVLNDLVWAVLQFTAMGVLLRFDVHRPWPYVLAWGAAATAAAVLGFAQLHVLPVLRGAASWVRGQLDLTGYLFLEYLLGAGSAQGSILLVGAVGSVGDVGSLRAAQVLLGPLAILTTAITTFTLPEVSRRTALSAARRHLIARGLSAFAVVVSLLYGAVLLLIPRGLGTDLLGATWTGAHSVLVPMALSAAMAGACMGPAIVIYAAGLTRRTFVLHVVEAPVVIVAVVGGLLLDGVVGAAWGLAISEAIMAPLWFWQLAVLRFPAVTPGTAADAAAPTVVQAIS